ncbi:uncharacterized protein LOC112167431 isoform X1 [Rosa chinensis]|uniref:uncharacterized protein LOC112167431 isoform X1 n=1 Tax=Rosa chinensis TaxID=74649 RepID=UPI000D08828B|nr:uncharacterized protein LOC112167431 isoform X1 [Rosa chinensis]XP_040362741.1 uncharacterized protein LOC112167431 isoform X1 [Rosa chinensis]
MRRTTVDLLHVLVTSGVLMRVLLRLNGFLPRREVQKFNNFGNEKNNSRFPSRPCSKWGSDGLANASETKRFSPKVRSAKVYNETKFKEADNFGNIKSSSRSTSRPRSTWGSDKQCSETKRFSSKVRSAKVYNETKFKEADNFGNIKSSSRSTLRPRSTWGSDKQCSETKRFSPKVRSEKRSNKTKVKDDDKMESITTDDGRSASLKKHNQIKPDLQKSPNISLPNTVKKKARNKNISDEGSEVLDGQPKNKKQMRLDPYDISNKRLDDNIATNENLKERKTMLRKTLRYQRTYNFVQSNHVRQSSPMSKIICWVIDA